MGSEFLVYFRLGYEHIADPAGYDHILFITALCAVYELKAWRPLLVLVTAFTVGHSITLALATLRLIAINDALIEFLIPVTIFVTSVVNIVEVETAEVSPVGTGANLVESVRARRIKYGLALGFGLIHGMGFSNFLRAVLGAEESLLVPLLAFNLGLEGGQIGILMVVLVVSYAAVRWMRRRDWILVLSGATAGVALVLMLDRLLV